MKKCIIYIILIALISFYHCSTEIKSKNETLSIDASSTDTMRVKTIVICYGEEKYYKYESDYDELENYIIELYNKPREDYSNTIKVIDSLLLIINVEKNEVKKELLSILIDDLHYFKGELYYYNGFYNKSIDEMEYYSGYERDIAIACNYVKLKNLNKAKIILDSLLIGNFCDYVKANYFEIIDAKNTALEMYKKSIEEDETRKHFVHYKLSVERIKELEKQNPKLLDEIYFVTGNPSFEVCDSDDENRSKIFDLISNLDEIKNDPECNGTWIYEDPYDNGKDYYWIKVGNGLISTNFKTKYNFIIYKETFEIRFYDTIINKTISLEEWRKNGI